MSTSDSDIAGESATALLYDGHSLVRQDVRLTITGRGSQARLAVVGDAVALNYPMEAVQLGERVGSVRRFVQLPDGASLEVIDNTPFDAQLRRASLTTLEASVGRLEARWKPALLAVVAAAAMGWGFVVFGLPALAARAVAFLPPSIDARVGADSLQLLDRGMFAATTLPAARQAQLQRAFASVASDCAAAGYTCTLQLRAGRSFGANAMALPSGIIVLTDELANLAANDDELRAVFAHEVGHVVGRHAMRQMLQSSAFALFAVGVLGDVSSASSLLAGAPTVLVNARYSRDLEREADAFARRWMRRNGVAPQRLGDLLARAIEQSGGADIPLLSSHPSLRERSQPP